MMSGASKKWRHLHELFFGDELLIPGFWLPMLAFAITGPWFTLAARADAEKDLPDDFSGIRASMRHDH